MHAYRVYYVHVLNHIHIDVLDLLRWDNSNVFHSVRSISLYRYPRGEDGSRNIVRFLSSEKGKKM